MCMPMNTHTRRNAPVGGKCAEGISMPVAEYMRWGLW